jgi:hypothetical protein
MGLDAAVQVAMDCLKESVFPLNLALPPLSNPFPFGIGGGGACVG